MTPSETAGGRAGDEANRSTVTRRRFLGAGAAVATTALAGCSDILGGGDEGPAAAVRSFYGALDEGDVETANGYIHPDGEAQQISEQQAGQLEQVDFSVDSAEVAEQDGDQATVDVTLTVSAMGQEQTSDAQIELRRHEGQWKIWSGSAAN